ncbi:hypothetical protein Q5P01_015548 [Channa striata]|uniref:Uncharacterized protein n=1 Tax=Channa striata TaxID=64152 RepID=A0AA88MBM6_CHASR|nr:hypothetical protein Q5P01_015548 [Channa striata]
MRMAFLCFNTPDPAAVNATKLYDYNNDDGDLWNRQSQLPPCSSSPSPPEFLCLVCLQIMVYAVCRNLTNGVEMVMEGVGVHINIVKSECPKLLSDDDHTGHLNSAIIASSCIIIIIIGLVLYTRWRRRRGQQQQRDRHQMT